MRSLVLASMAVAVIAVGCASKTGAPTTAGQPPAAPPATAAASAPEPAVAAATPPATATPPAAAPTTPSPAPAQTAAAQPPPAQPTGAQPPAAPTTPSSAPAQTTAAQPPPAQPATALSPATEGGRGGRGRGNPPPPPTPPPAVMPPPVTPIVSATAPSPDPRVGLTPGRWDAGQAAWNMRLVSTTPPSEKFLGVTNSDLAFTGKYVIQGNYNGFQVYDITDPAKPVTALTYICPASQSDVSVYKHLLFVSGEGQTGRIDCGIQGVPEPVSKDRLRGIRIFDISNITSPKYVGNVQTCRGSHTHTVVTDPNDKENVYIYVSGSARVRSEEELPGCKDGGIDDPNSARFRLEVIKVPIKAPEKAAIVSSPRIFYGLAPPPRRVEPGRGGAGAGAGVPGDADPFSSGGRGGGRGAGAGEPAAAGAGATGAGAAGAGAAGAGAAGAGAAGAGAAGAGATPPAGGRGGRGAAGPPTGPNQCHDITVYPDIGLAGGACGGYGLLLDIREVAHPLRIDAVADINMSFWHSATFSNDGKKILFSDEWGGGTQPRCRETDKLEWGANALFTLEKDKMIFKSYYKMPAAQTSFENCVAHNGSLIPIPGREVMAQGWYQGGVSVFDWTDVSKPTEIAFFDRGPIDGTRLISGGSWSVYWYNGLIVSSEIARGLDIFELLPSGLITQNELDAAKTVTFDYINAQEQRKIAWPPSFAKARAFVDQLERSKGLESARINSVRTELASAEKAARPARQAALKKLAGQLTGDAKGSPDQVKVRMLADAVRELVAVR